MTLSQPPTQQAQPATAAESPRRRRRPSRGAWALGALLVATLAVLVWAGRGSATGYLDPIAVDPAGSRAIATVLGNNGVSVSRVTTTEAVRAQAAGATLLVATPELLTPEVVDEMLAAGPARIVLIGANPGSPAMNRLGAGIESAQGVPADTVDPGCDYVPAVRAGNAQLPGVRYDAQAWVPRAQACYDSATSAGLVVIPAGTGRPEVVLLGSPKPLQNDGFADAGNASLGLSLLGSSSELVWWLPDLSDPAIADTGGQTPLSELLPNWVLPVTIQLFICALALAWWRSRRMGPLVREPLPVVIRAGETTAGRARLLQAAHARGTAAEHLREQSRQRLRGALGLPVGAPSEVLLAAVASRSALPTGSIEQLLFGPEPSSDAQLVSLQADLTNLVQEVAHQ